MNVFRRSAGATAVALLMTTATATSSLGGGPRTPAGADPDAVIRCVTLDQETFCTELGFVPFTKGSAEWDAHLEAALAAAPSDTGDMTLATVLSEAAALSRDELAARQNEQIQTARGSVGRVKLARSLADGTELPPGFFSRYPELAITEGSARAADVRAEVGRATALQPDGAGSLAATAAVTATSTVPDARTIMSGSFFKQEKSYWCGPATMQSIDFADDGTKDSQSWWASSMGTTTDGTSIWAMVKHVNDHTTWDSKGGGTYTVLSTPSTNTATWFLGLHRSRIGMYGSPVVEHTQLLRAHFPYLNRDHGGHYQSGRGYNTTSRYIYIIEPYNEADWSSTGAASAGYRTVGLDAMWKATLANPNRNIGW